MSWPLNPNYVLYALYEVWPLFPDIPTTSAFLKLLGAMLILLLPFTHTSSLARKQWKSEKVT